METITFFVYQQWSEVMLFCGVHVQHSFISGQIGILNIQKVIPLVAIKEDGLEEGPPLAINYSSFSPALLHHLTRGIASI